MTHRSWTIDPSHSSIQFSVRHMVFAKVRGRFTDWEGTLELDPQDLATGRTSVSIDAASIDTGTPARDEHLRSADFFDVKTFPKLTFQSTRVVEKGGAHEVHGRLTIRDVTRDVVLEAQLAGAGTDPWGNERLGFSAKTSLDRKEFGLNWNQVLEAGGVLVGDRIEIELEIQAVAAASKAA